MGATSVLAGWLLRTVLLYGLWLALVDNVHSAELIAGLPAAMVAAGLATAAHRLVVDPVRIRPGMLVRLPAALLGLITETGTVVGVLARALAGRHRPSRFRAGRFGATQDTPLAAGRRALTEWMGSIGPNRYVV